MRLKTLAEAAWEYAGTQLHVREIGGNNLGPDVERYQKRVGGKPGEAWCAAFVSTCVFEGVKVAGGPPSFQGGRGALKLLEKNAHLRIKHPRDAKGQPFVGVQDHGKGLGHCFLAVWDETRGIYLVSREGNTGPGPNVPAKDREGNGVYPREDRTISSCAGFLLIA